MHYGLALSWSPLYVLLRRRGRMGPLGSGTPGGLPPYRGTGPIGDQFRGPDRAGRGPVDSSARRAWTPRPRYSGSLTGRAGAS